MPKTIVQEIRFDAPASVLFSFYMDEKLHAEISGESAIIGTKEGEAYSVFGGYATGINLRILPSREIVQTWRGSDWKSEDADSIFILLFVPDGDGTIAYMTHANLPDDQYEDIAEGWNTYYWEPWRQRIRQG